MLHYTNDHFDNEKRGLVLALLVSLLLLSHPEVKKYLFCDPKGLVPFTQLVKVRRNSLFWYFRASDFHETFTRSSLALNMSRKLVLDPYLAIHGKIMAKNSHFFMEF